MRPQHIADLPVNERSWGLDSVYAVGYAGGRKVVFGTPAAAPPSYYADEGCEIAPRCLDCCLPRCRYDLPPKRAGALVREAQLRDLLAAGLTADQAAVRMGVSRRTVFRLKRSAATRAILPLFTERTAP